MEVAGNGTLYALAIVAAIAVLTTAGTIFVVRQIGRNAPRRAPRHTGWWITPALAYVTALTIIPFYYLLYISFLNWNVGLPPITFIGLGNYISSVFSPSFQTAFLLTLEVGIGFTAFQLLMGMGIALLLHTPGKMASFVTTSFILPLMMTPFLIYTIWFGLTTPLVGWLNYFVRLITGNINPLFFAKSPQVFFTLLTIDTWEWLPFVVVILVAGLRALPNSPLEAAAIDGASAWSKFIHVQLPLLRPVIAIVLLFRVVASLSLLDSIEFFTKGGPGGDTTVLSYFIYLTGFGAEERIGLASAQSFIFLILVFAIAGALMFYIYRGSLGRR
ncbi:MAG: sugar ABC transporter permease [Thaumarchaeota archaeon]|nr:sugar ABC transporter permease [Nitrososphaerota archaeon]